MRIRPVVAAVLTATVVGGGATAAYTASLTGTPSSKVLGFGVTSISGATMTSSTYGYNTDYSTVTSITVLLNGDTSTSALSVSANSAAPVACAAGSYSNPSTTYVCTVSFAVSTLTSVAYVLA